VSLQLPQQNASDISDKNTLGSPKFAYAPEQLKETRLLHWAQGRPSTKCSSISQSEVEAKNAFRLLSVERWRHCVCNGGCVCRSQGAAAAAAPPVLPGSGGAQPASVHSLRPWRTNASSIVCAPAASVRWRILSPRAPSSPNSISATERDTKRALRSWLPCLPSGELVSRCGLFEDRLSSRYCVRILEDKLIYRRR